MQKKQKNNTSKNSKDAVAVIVAATSAASATTESPVEFRKDAEQMSMLEKLATLFASLVGVTAHLGKGFQPDYGTGIKCGSTNKAGTGAVKGAYTIIRSRGSSVAACKGMQQDKQGNWKNGNQNADGYGWRLWIPVACCGTQFPTELVHSSGNRVQAADVGYKCPLAGADVESLAGSALVWMQKFGIQLPEQAVAFLAERASK